MRFLYLSPLLHDPHAITMLARWRPGKRERAQNICMFASAHIEMRDEEQQPRMEKSNQFIFPDNSSESQQDNTFVCCVVQKLTSVKIEKMKNDKCKRCNLNKQMQKTGLPMKINI